MSRMHVKLTKVFQDQNIIDYAITTPDFYDEIKDVKFGIIEINLKSGKFVHKDNTLWEKSRILPISFFETSIEERKLLASTKFKGYFSGQYGSDVLDFIKKSFETNYYPDEKLIIR